MKKYLNKFKTSNSGIVNYLISMLFVVIIASILIIIQGSNPIIAFLEMFKGAFNSKAAISSSIRWAIPVIIASQAAVVAHRSGINNLGLEGQIYFGALATALVGAFVSLPPLLHIPLAIIAGGLAGLLYALIPALLKKIFKIDEMITTLMFNYIAILLTEFIVLQMMGLNSGTNPDLIATPEIKDSAVLKLLFPPYQASIGIFIAILIALLVYTLYRRFRIGYEWKMIGDNYKFSKYGGIKVVTKYLLVFLISGFIAGICGGLEILGPHRRFRSNFSTNLGWDGIMVALIAKNKPIPTLFVAILWGFIKAGSLSMERMTSVNRIIVTLVQALFVLFVTIDIKGKIINKIRKNKLSKEEVNHA